MIDRKQIPPHLHIALDVTEQEYQCAKKQNVILWLITMSAGLVGLIVWFLGIQLLGFVTQPIVAAFAAYSAGYQLLGEARKMLTQRMRTYTELKTYRAFLEKKSSETNASKEPPVKTQEETATNAAK